MITVSQNDSNCQTLSMMPTVDELESTAVLACPLSDEQ